VKRGVTYRGSGGCLTALSAFPQSLVVKPNSNIQGDGREPDTSCDVCETSGSCPVHCILV